MIARVFELDETFEFVMDEQSDCVELSVWNANIASEDVVSENSGIWIVLATLPMRTTPLWSKPWIKTGKARK